MNNPNLDMPAFSSETDFHARRNDYPTEVEEIYQQEFKQFDTKDCRVKTYVAGLAECLTPQFCHHCNNSIPFSSTFFCKHPLMVAKTEKPTGTSPVS